MITRDAEKTIHAMLRSFPIVTITGPRQSGKTTLAKAIFTDKPYASLEDPDIRLFARDDPRSFLDRFPDGAVIDEIQRCPELFSYLQSRVDADGRMGLYILTGSQQFGLLSQITQSLAGRTGFLELLPFSLPELKKADLLPTQVDTILYKGSYPPIYDRDIPPNIWFSAYTTTYVERDVRQILQIQDLETFQRFIRLCAGRTGQLLNFSALASECGITHNTVKSWISVMEASYIVFLLRPHHANFKKRLVKMPKLYFYDVGLASWLLGIRTPEHITTHPLRGALFETFILSELLKARMNKGERPGFFFWRDSNGNEVDVIEEQSGKLRPIEIKSGQTIQQDYFKGLKYYDKLAGINPRQSFVIYGGDQKQITKDGTVIGWREIGSII